MLNCFQIKRNKFAKTLEWLNLEAVFVQILKCFTFNLIWKFNLKMPKKNYLLWIQIKKSQTNKNTFKFLLKNRLNETWHWKRYWIHFMVLRSNECELAFHFIFFSIEKFTSFNENVSSLVFSLSQDPSLRKDKHSKVFFHLSNRPRMLFNLIWKT